MSAEFATTAVVLRAANQADADAVTDCVRSAYQHFVARIGQPPAPMLADYARVIAQRTVIIAELDHAVAGVLVLHETDEHFLLENVAVDPARQGQGIGRTLLEYAERCSVQAGHGAIHLYTNALMVENRYLYMRLGYREYDRRTEQGFARVYMRKVLSLSA